MTTGKARPQIDWDAIERDYRAGVLSLREIGGAHGVSHTAIQKRQTRDGWERDLGPRIAAKAEALVAKREVAKQVSSDKAATEREIIDANAERIAQVRSEHRSDISRARSLSLSLLAELEAETGDKALFEQLGEMMRNPDEKGMDRLNDAYRKAISLPSRITSAKALADSLKVLVGLEREAYGLSVEPSGQSGGVSSMTIEFIDAGTISG